MREPIIIARTTNFQTLHFNLLVENEDQYEEEELDKPYEMELIRDLYLSGDRWTFDYFEDILTPEE